MRKPTGIFNCSALPLWGTIRRIGRLVIYYPHRRMGMRLRIGSSSINLRPAQLTHLTKESNTVDCVDTAQYATRLLAHTKVHALPKYKDVNPRGTADRSNGGEHRHQRVRLPLVPHPAARRACTRRACTRRACARRQRAWRGEHAVHPRARLVQLRVRLR